MADSVWRHYFPALHQKVRGKHLIYLDNAATSQKPLQVIEAMDFYYRFENANVHRGVHYLSGKASEAYEAVRSDVADWIHAHTSEEVIFTRGTTESINLVAQSYIRAKYPNGCNVLVSELEHHANIVPWQLAGASLNVIPILDDGSWNLSDLDSLLTKETALVAISWVSNSLGTINPVHQVIQAAHRRGIPVLVDAAQAVAHFRPDVREMDADFMAFSGHKMYGPTGIGILYGKKALLDTMSPWQGGGDMIDRVTFTQTTYNEVPFRFEAGTPHIAGVVGLGAAIRFMQEVGLEHIQDTEHALAQITNDQLRQINGLTLVGTARERVPVFSFNMQGAHHLDIGTFLDAEGIAVRTGHHCCQPVMDRYGISGTVRASFSFYNTAAEAEALAVAIRSAYKILNPA